jgi:hypothetical protein
MLTVQCLSIFNLPCLGVNLGVYLENFQMISFIGDLHDPFQVYNAFIRISLTLYGSIIRFLILQAFLEVQIGLNNV